MKKFLLIAAIITISFAAKPFKKIVKCTNSNEINIGKSYYYYDIKSLYSGKILYNCSPTTEYTHSLSSPFVTITDITKKSSYKGLVDSINFEALITYYYKEGKVQIFAKYGDLKIECQEWYIPAVPATFNSTDLEELNELLKNWGEEGPCSPKFIKTTCPIFYYDEISGCSIDGEVQSSIIDRAENIEVSSEDKIYILDSTATKSYIKTDKRYIIKK